MKQIKVNMSKSFILLILVLMSVTIVSAQLPPGHICEGRTSTSDCTQFTTAEDCYDHFDPSQGICIFSVSGCFPDLPTCEGYSEGNNCAQRTEILSCSGLSFSECTQFFVINSIFGFPQPCEIDPDGGFCTTQGQHYCPVEGEEQAEIPEFGGTSVLIMLIAAVLIGVFYIRKK